MKIGTISGYDYESGGTAHVKYDIWRALKKEHEMVLYSFTKHNNGIIPNKSLIPWRTYRLTMLQWYCSSMVTKLARDCDLLLYLEGVVGFPNRGGDLPIIIYNHAGIRGTGFTKSNGIRKLYYNILEPKFEQAKEQVKSDKNIHILTNSKYTASMIREDVGRDATIIYPGVDISGFKPTNESPRQWHRSGVISIGRFNLDKHYDKTCAIMERLDVPYTIMGFVRYPQEREYYAMLKKKYPNVRLIPNPSISKMKEQLHKSKVYLHGKVEDFGISIVEAIAAGCVPIAPDAGGIKETVPISEVRYTNMDDIANMILKAVSGHYDCHLPHLQKHIEQYDTPVFDEAIRKFVRDLSV